MKSRARSTYVLGRRVFGFGKSLMAATIASRSVWHSMVVVRQNDLSSQDIATPWAPFLTEAPTASASDSQSSLALSSGSFGASVVTVLVQVIPFGNMSDLSLEVGHGS